MPLHAKLLLECVHVWRVQVTSEELTNIHTDAQLDQWLTNVKYQLVMKTIASPHHKVRVGKMMAFHTFSHGKRHIDVALEFICPQYGRWVQNVSKLKHPTLVQYLKQN